MSFLSAARCALAQEVSGALPDVAVMDAPPATLAGGVAFVRAATEGYVSTTEGAATWSRPTVTLAVVLVAPSAEWAAAVDWLDEHIAAMLQAFRLRIASVGGHGRLDTNSQLVAAEIRFTPTHVKDTPS